MEYPEDLAVRCVFDFNTALGATLRDKTDSLYVVLTRIHSIIRHKHKHKHELNTLIVSPLVRALLEVVGYVESAEETAVGELVHVGKAFVRYDVHGKAADGWKLLVDYDTCHEQRIYMTNLEDEDAKLSPDPTRWARVSLANCVMDNKFGYYNLE